MSPLLSPLRLLLMMLAGWTNRPQVDVIEYLKEENRVLKERLGGQPIPCSSDNARLLGQLYGK